MPSKITARLETTPFGLVVNVYDDMEHQYGVPVRSAKHIADPHEREIAVDAVARFAEIVGEAAFYVLARPEGEVLGATARQQ